MSNSLYEIKHRATGVVLFSLECESLKICVEAAVANHCDLSHADLSHANLRNANLRNANLSFADLHFADLRSADLRHVDLSCCDLRSADFRSADFRSADLCYANLFCADLSSADLDIADLRFTDLSFTDLSNTVIIDGGQDARGFRVFAWRHKDGNVIYRAGCHEWSDYAEACDYYGDSYSSTGNKKECLARLHIIHQGAIQRGWIS